MIQRTCGHSSPRGIDLFSFSHKIFFRLRERTWNKRFFADILVMDVLSSRFSYTKIEAIFVKNILSLELLHVYMSLAIVTCR